MGKGSIKKNFVYNMAYQIFSVLTPLITSPIISRRLGATALGEFSYSYSVAFYFLLFGMLGIKNYGSRYMAQHNDNIQERSKAFCSLYLFQFTTTSFFIVAYLIYCLFLCRQNRVLAYVQIMLVVSSMFDITWFYFGTEQFKTTALRNFIVKLINVICIVLFIHNVGDLPVYTVIMAGGVLVSQLVLWPQLKGQVILCKVNIRDIVEHFKPNVILFVPVIATNLFKYMDKIMLGNWVAFSELGFYENAEKLMQIPNSVVTTIGTVMLPRMSSIVKQGDQKQYHTLLSNSMILSIAMSCAMAFGIMGISKPFVPLFFGKEFTPVVTLLYWLLPCMPFICWGDVLRTQYLIPNKKDLGYLVSFCGGAILNLLINWVLIPKYGAVGASIGTLVAESSVAIIQTLMVLRNIPVVKLFGKSFPFVIIGGIMYAAIINISVYSNIITIMVRILIGGVTYSTLSIVYLYFADKSFLMNILPIKERIR